jgi:beta-alanine degradation protein BauB
MKRLYILLFVLLAAGFVRGDALIAPTQDSLVVNADTTKLKLENDRVRVLEVTLKPGVKEKVHSHPAYVIYIVEGGKIRNHASDGTSTDVEFKTGDTAFRDPLTHSAENIGTTTVRVHVVELKK